MKQSKRVLFISSEINPYLPESHLANSSKESIVHINNSDYEVRALMPKYGVINERKHQLHEVVRLSGMNIPIQEVLQPLIIKVASLPKERVQVYFIDNEDFFSRKAIFGDDENEFFDDNHLRLIFFTRGVIETIKKLGWAPDIIHIQGWMAYLVPLFIRKVYPNEPIFANSKIVLSYFNNDSFDQKLNDFVDHIPELKELNEDSLTDHLGLTKAVASYVNGAIIPNNHAEVKQILKDHDTQHIIEVDENATHDTVLDEIYAKVLAD